MRTRHRARENNTSAVPAEGDRCTTSPEVDTIYDDPAYHEKSGPIVRFWRWLFVLYYRWEVHVGFYMLDTNEKIIFYTVLLALVGLLGYGTYHIQQRLLGMTLSSLG